MGAWGPAIFSDDTACDIPFDYRELLEDGVEDPEATRRIIDGDGGLELWTESGGKELAKRKAALSNLRETLTGPQKPATKVRRPCAHTTVLSPGDVLAYTAPDGKRHLFRVANLDAGRLGTAPVLRRPTRRGDGSGPDSRTDGECDRDTGAE